MQMQRIDWIDHLRGMVIILVTIGHALEGVGCSDNFFKHLIYSFHMPLMFAVSGYIATYLIVKGKGNLIFTCRDWHFVLRKFNALIIPYLAWGFVVGPFFFSSYSSDSLDCLGKIAKVFLVNNTGIWFLPCLFGLFVLLFGYGMIRNVLHVNLYGDALFLCVGFVTTLLLWKVTGSPFLRSIVSYFPPFFLGVFAAQHKKVDVVMFNSGAVYSCSLLSFCVIVGLFIYRGEPKLIRLLCGLLSIPVAFQVVSNLRLGPKVSRLLSFIGQNTLLIYIAQSRFLYSFSSLGDVLTIYGGRILPLIVATALSVIVIAIILLINLFIARSRLFSFVLLGRRWNG